MPILITGRRKEFPDKQNMGMEQLNLKAVLTSICLSEHFRYDETGTVCLLFFPVKTHRRL